MLGLKELKIISFGPRPADFYACNAPIAPLFELGVNIQENSELDLLVAYRKHEGRQTHSRKRFAEMEDELGEGNQDARRAAAAGAVRADAAGLD